MHYESATYATWQSKYLDLAARHGIDAEVYVRVPFAFYRKSMSSAHGILAARRGGDAGTEVEALAASHALWCEHKLKLAPCGPPPLGLGPRPRLVADGFSVLWPFSGKDVRIDGEAKGK